MDNSRFKFRAYITVSYEDDDGNEKEVSFYLYNVYMSDEGDFIYIDREFLLDTLVNYDDETQDKIEEVLQENSATGDYENICIERGFYKNPEQCTGLKDKNGKLIYEGDIVKVINGKYEYLYKVIWEDCAFVLKPTSINDWEDTKYLEDWLCSSETFEVIGNIHNNKKEEK